MSFNDLIDAFENGKLINEGILFIHADTVGKPGDRIITLKKIEIGSKNSLLLSFGKGEKIEIEQPENIKFDVGKLVIQNASYINWKSSDFEFIYVRKNNEIDAKLISGKHVFKIIKGRPAFEFVNW